VIESTKTYITNFQNNKKVYFRKQLLPFLLIVSLMGLVVLNYIRDLSDTVQELRHYQDVQSATTDELVVMFKSQRDEAVIKVFDKQKEVDQKSQELEKVTKDLNSKDQELTAKIQELKSKETEVLDLQKKISNQEAQLAANSTELNQLRSRPPLFSFDNESSLPDFEDKKNQVQDVVSSAYDEVANLYGQPYLLHSITITFVDNFSIEGASGEIQINNSSKGLSIDIRLRDFSKTNFNDVNAIIHEIIHSFHGIGVFDTTVYEEGMTTAATDVVLANLITSGKVPNFSHLYLTLSTSNYNSYNNSLSVPAESEAFYNSSNISKFYQMSGMAWYKLYEADHGFFKKFNEEYYSHIQNGETGDDELVKSIIKNNISTVEDSSIDSYLANQKVFNPN